MWPLRCWMLLVVLANVATLRAETVIIAGDPWCPINCAADSARPGIFVELAQQIFAEAGIQVQYRNTNWARTLRQVRSGQLNAAIGAGRDDAPDFLFTEPAVVQARNCFYTRLDSTWRYSGPDSLLPLRLGVINDYSYGAVLNAYISAHSGNVAQVQQASGERALALSVGKLLRGRVDVVLENTWVMQHLLTVQGDSGKLREAGCREHDVPIYLAFSPVLDSSPRYARIFAEGIARYRADGRFQQILANYGVQAP